MQTIKQLYRKDYLGEDIVTTRTYENSKWNAETEYLPNQIVNMQVSNRALIIGNGPSRNEVDLNIAARNTAGLRGKLKLQTYGCNALYRDFAPDFLVAVGADIVSEVAASGYCDTHVVYSSTNGLMNNPGKFYHIPQDPRWNAGTLATYLACFDGHTKIFLLGFDGNDTADVNYNVYNDTPGYPAVNDTVTESFWVQTMDYIFNLYPDVDFVRVAPTEAYRMPDQWRYRTNLRQIDFRQFVLEADL